MRMDDLNQRVDKLEQYSRNRVALDKRRSDGPTAIRVDSLGDLKRFWGTTGPVSDGSSKVIFLTWNREAGGDSMFTATPRVTVYRNKTANEVLNSGAEPNDPALRTTLRAHLDFDVDWVFANRVYSVTVENNEGDGNVYDFAVLAEGV